MKRKLFIIMLLQSAAFFSAPLAFAALTSTIEPGAVGRPPGNNVPYQSIPWCFNTLTLPAYQFTQFGYDVYAIYYPTTSSCQIEYRSPDWAAGSGQIVTTTTYTNVTFEDCLAIYNGLCAQATSEAKRRNTPIGPV